MAANLTTTINGNIVAGYLVDSPKSTKKEIIGFNYPLGSVSRGGYFSKKSGIELVKNSVKQLLLTEKGQRVMLPNFGCSLRQYLFQPLDEITFEGIRKEIQTSFANYIIGARLVKISVFPTGDAGPAGGNSLQVVLSLKLDSDQFNIFDVEVNIS